MSLTSICYQYVRMFPILFTVNNSTSFFIAKNFLLTSAHNVTKIIVDNVKTITLYPARIHNSKEFDSIVLPVNYKKNVRYLDSYHFLIASTRRPHDIALIYISDALIKSNPKLREVVYLTLLEDTSSLKVGETLYFVGYPAADLYNQQFVMTMDTSTVSALNTNYFEHKLETLKGNSGSPIMVKRNGRFYVVGINSIEYGGTWINDEKKLLIKRWMSELKSASK